jgi:hypothetical protein
MIYGMRKARVDAMHRGLPLFTNCLEDVFSATGLPIRLILGNLMGKKEPGLLGPGLAALVAFALGRLGLAHSQPYYYYYYYYY